MEMARQGNGNNAYVNVSYVLSRAMELRILHIMFACVKIRLYTTYGWYNRAEIISVAATNNIIISSYVKCEGDSQNVNHSIKINAVIRSANS